MWCLFLCAILLALAGTASAWAQQQNLPYTYRNWSVQEGLPQVSVNAIAQTPDGYLWVGTNGGLVRFDGIAFKVYNTANTPAIKSNRIMALAVDQQGRLWIGGGEYIMWWMDGTFQSMYASANYEASVFFEDRDGSMWVGIGNILRRFDLATLTYEDVYVFDVLNTITTIYRDEGGRLWIGTKTSLYAFDGETMIPDAPIGGVVIAKRVQALLSDGPDAYWILTSKNLLYVANGHAKIILSEEERNNVSGHDILLQDHRGNIWTATDTGVYFIEKTSQTYAPPRTVTAASEVKAFFEDREHSLWLGSVTQGLFRFTTKQVRTPVMPTSQAGRNMLAILEARDGSMWLTGNCSGLRQWQEGKIISYQPDVLEGCVWSLAESADGTIWVGTWGGGLHRWMNGDLRKVEAPYVNSDAAVVSMYEDRQGALWLGMLLHLVRVDPDGSHQIFNTENGLPHNDVRVIYETPQGELWVGTQGGLAHRSGNTWISYTTEDGLSNNHVRAIYEDAEGTLWIGTYGGGLNRLKDGQFSRYTSADGLKDDTISRIFEDEHGRLWLSGNRGISSISWSELNDYAAGEIARLTPALYTEADGMPHRETNGGFQPAGWQRTNGEMWFPTQAGIAIIDTDQLAINEVPPPVQISSVRIDGASQQVTHSLVLDRSTHNLEIDYAGLSFVDPEQVQYRYRLLGYDEQWNNVGNRRTAYFNNLASGSYTFQVSASNNDGVWNTDGARLSIFVPTPWWHTNMAYASYILLGLLMVWGYVYLRTHTLERRREETEALLAERTQELREQSEKLQALDIAKSRFFANISHEFRTPLTLSLGPLEDIATGRHGPLTEEAHQQVDLVLLNNRRLLRLVNQLLDMARVNADQLTLHVRPLHLTDFLASLARAFEPLAERKQIRFTTAVPSQEVVVYADASQLETGVLNLLSNAFKFTPEHGQITLTLRTNEREVCIEVKDSGPGIPTDQIPLIFDRFHQVDADAYRHEMGTGIGLALTKELVELHGGRMDVESVEEWGSAFRIYLRYGKAHFAGTPHNVEDAPATAPTASEVASLSTLSDPQISETEDEADDLPEDRTTVLLVEDNAEIRAFIRSHLSETYRVVEAVNGADGLRQARVLSPDLILSDVMMPEMDGYELCEALRQDPELDFIPVILLTARAETVDRLEGLGQGADDYLTKPFNVEELQARIRNLIVQRQRLRERFSATELAAVAAVDVESSDDAFVQGVRAAIEAHLADPAFNVAALADTVAMDRTTLYRRLKTAMNMSPTTYMRTVRLEHAARLLEAEAGTVSEIAYGVGFQSVPHFTTSFRKRYGCTPTQYSADHSPA